ncbi:MAG: amino acid adenylation domain-containing protein [Moorea sp. SIOASIH]|uniref:non-ribosomal peptide synthetase n=1 Tax=Moorena sp. SIOASIH TaxID=2607817 RepID=UPI0013BC889C|nr:non-ribosomal peptide synthetase [Moorena sp. SIOASIH]NEO42370.1 amino acid adenylation domain-containing protein [Moorena sp. SIOASIH]
MNNQTIVKFLSQLRKLNVQVSSNGEKLRCQAPEGVLTPALSQQIAERKAEILAYLKQVRQKKDSNSPAISVISRDENLPLSFAQERLWFINQLEGSTVAYNSPGVLRISGNLNLNALQQALSDIVRRHEVLRTSFQTVNGTPIQVIDPKATLNLKIVDLQEIEVKERETVLQQQIQQEITKPFKLERAPLIRCRLWQLDGTEYVFSLTMHHIISDAWSIGIFIQELSTLYRAFTQGEPSPLAKLPIQYVDFAMWQRQWLNGGVLETQLNYWRKQLDGAPDLLELPTDHPRSSVHTFRGAQHSVILSKSIVTSLNALAQSQGVTLFSILVTALKILLFKWTGQSDIVLGTVIAGRNRSELEPLIGCFINFLAVRNHLNGQQRAEEFLQQVGKKVVEAYSNQDCPFQKIIEALNPDRQLSHNPIYNVALLLQNFPLKGFFNENLEATPIDIDLESSLLDLRFVILESSEKMRIDCEYNTDLFESDTIKQLVEGYQETLERLVQQLDSKLSDFELSAELEVKAKAAKARDKKQKIAIAATFTAEPVEESLTFWMEELDLPSEIQFAPYNQVFQELLNPVSLIATNQDCVNIVLVRFEDWLRNQKTSQLNGNAAGKEGILTVLEQPDKKIEQIEQNVRDIASALKTAARDSSTPYLVCICPPSTTAESEDIALYLRMEEFLASYLEELSSIYLVKSSELVSLYPVSDYYDPHGDELGHIPYKPTFFSALGSMLARKIHALKSIPYKVIVLDCDETLWKGVCGEDGAAGVEIDAPHQALQEFIVTQQRAGKLICLCSKNQEVDVWAVFEHHDSMPLRKEHLVSWRINWKSKSENLKALAQELQLGLDSFIFIDDNPIECAEVQANCPEVLTIQLPTDSRHIPDFIKHIWAFDQLKVTAEDAARTDYYRQNVEREKVRHESLTFEEFLDGLELRVKIDPPQLHQLPRVAQLTQRTNQFNLTTIRRSEGDVKEFCALEKQECLVVEVKDRFGDYGLVGVLMFELGADVLRVDSFLLSCRVLGRGVEHQMLAKLGDIASDRGLIHVDVPYIPTQKNKPALDFLESVSREGKESKGEGFLFKFKVDEIKELTFSPGQFNGIATKKLPTQKDVSTIVQYQLKSGRYERIATELRQAVQVLKVIEERKQKERPELKGVFVAPRNQGEEMIAGIWRDVLKLEQVGINDNFFELGGHSLLATQLISKLREAFELELPLRTIFESPTVAKLDQTLTQLRTNDSGLNLPPIQPRIEREQLPLSWAQERLWFLNQLEGSSATYNMPGVVHITGNLKLNALQQALSEIVRRHEVLRTCFPTVNSTPRQVIDPEANLKIKVVDLQQLEVTDRETLLQQQLQQSATTPFNLEIAPLIRCSLWQLNGTEYVFFLAMHHIVSDGWSIGIFIQELSILYQAFTQGEPSPLAELPIQYADFAVWQREYLSGEVLETQINYWQKQLNGAPELLQLPTDHPRPAVQTYRGATQTFTLSTDLTQKLQTLSGKSGTTLFMTLEAAFATLLYRYSGQSDILIGSPIANRNRSEIESIIGCFVNTLVLRNSLKDNPSFESLLTQVRETTLKAYEHQDVPFEQVVEALQPQRSLSHSPLFQVLFVLQNIPMGEVEIPGVTLSQLDIESTIAKFDLTLSITETNQGLVGSWEYNTDLFDGSTIERMAGHFQNLLSAIVENPQLSVAEFPLLSKAEQHQLLLEWNDTASEYSSNKCIHQLFESQVEKKPDAVAVMFENQQLTYQQLNQRANQLAHHLQSLGVGPEVLVGICVQRSVEMLVGLLGILKAGGAYVPLDPNYPLERLTYILADSSVEVLLTQQSLLESLPQNQAQVVCLDADGGAIERNSQENLDLGVCSDNLAYAIYTSGSTGKPKGVQIQHKALVNFLESMQQKPGLESNDILLSVTTLSFDIAGLELYLPLITGARLVVVSREIAVDGILLAQSIEKYQVTTMQATPATWRLLLTAGWKGNKQLKILCGGEALDISIAEKLFKISQQVWNLYGPTEATIWSTVAQVDNDFNVSSVPIGRPINNTQVYILDKYLQPLPIGVPGELYIGGDGLARGYLNRPELTSGKFIPNSFSNSQSERLYKTGDLARYGSDGNIEFLGRIDNQVKVRGFRIELGEIESILNTYPQIQQAVVIATEDIPENKRLVAYVVKSDESLKTNQLRESLKQKLPEYMVPSAFVILDTLPLTPNGKVDHKALPAPDTAQLQENFVPPRDLVELQLTKIWSNILNICSVGVRDNFFDIGGNSLFAIRLMAQIEEQFQRNLSLATLFQGQTIEKLATVLREVPDHISWSSLVPIQTSGYKPPFFCIAGGGGNVLYFYHLSRYLGQDQPFYALQAVGLDGESEPFTRVEDMGAYYIKAIKSVQSQGPYFLGGHSFGALVAFEVAQQLQKHGNEVALLAILDMHAPYTDRPEPGSHKPDIDWDSGKMLTSIAGVFGRMFGKNIDVSYEFLQRLTFEEQLNYVNERFQKVNLFPPEIGVKQIRGLVQVARANQNACYVPQELYPTQVTLFRASEEVPIELAPSADIHRLLYDSRKNDPLWGWSEFSAGEVELHTVPGDHLTIMTEPYIGALAEKLKSSLEKAQTANPMERP